MIHDTSPQLTVLAARLATLPPSVGPVRLVAIDGHAGSGKSTFAARLADALGGAPVLHLDDLARHEAFFDWTDRLVAQVLEPLSTGRAATYDVYDWRERALRDTGVLPPAPVVLVEGVGAGRRALRPYLALSVWLEVPAWVAWERGRRRDGSSLAVFWDTWTRAERAHFARDPSRPYADVRVRLPADGEKVRACEPPGTGRSR